MLSFLKAHFNYGKSRTWFWQTCQVEMLVHETYKVRLYRGSRKKLNSKKKVFLIGIRKDYFRSRLL